MRVWFHRYTLTPKRRLSPLAEARQREGALLRIDDGFSDLHPWPELGDASLDEQLSLLARNELTPLTRASLKLAAADGNARRRGVSLFEGLQIPESHWPGPDPPPGFDTVKLKEYVAVDSRFLIRLDYNRRLTAEEFLRTSRELPSGQIDFIEDPCPYDASAWKRLRAETGLRLALDLPAGSSATTGAYDVLVVKPARHAQWPETEKDVVVTSSMDHPVGQLGAAWKAASLYGAVPRREPSVLRHGLVTHVLYESNPFIERMTLDGARLVPPEGTGIGFDDLLGKLTWKTLR
jgi:O-succinylbenzoate synthase